MYANKIHLLQYNHSILSSYIVVHLCNFNKSRYGGRCIMDIIVSDVIANDEIHEDIYPILPTLTVTYSTTYDTCNVCCDNLIKQHHVSCSNRSAATAPLHDMISDRNHQQVHHHLSKVMDWKLE